LTTIYIIIKYLELDIERRHKKPFNIRYDTRKDSGDFLKNLDRRFEYIDCYYFCEAWETVNLKVEQLYTTPTAILSHTMRAIPMTAM
jgi:hypothetical protein